MRLYFKHEDTRTVVLIVIVYLLVSVLAALIAPRAAIYVVVGYAVVAIVMMQINLYRRARLDADSDRIHLQDLLWLHSEGDFDAPLPPLTGWSAEPGLVALLQSIVIREKPLNVVELGSGVSTIVLGYALRNVGGSVTSLDHDEKYAAKTATEIERHGLQDVAVVRHEPLGAVSVGDREWRWYRDARSDLRQPIDLLVVDGPPFATGTMARYPALPFFYEMLADDAFVVLHDLYRIDEQRIVREWMEKYPDFEASYVETPKRIAVLRRRSSSATGEGPTVGRS